MRLLVILLKVNLFVCFKLLFYDCVQHATQLIYLHLYVLFVCFHFCVQKTAKSGLHILLGGICALTVVIFFRFVSNFIHLLSCLVYVKSIQMHANA